MREKTVCIGVLSAIFLFIGCSQAERQSTPDEVTVQLKWVHQTQFAGFYVAKERGYYTQENLNVDFLEGGADVDTTKSILSGKALFGVIASEMVMIKRQQLELPITAIAAIYQRSAVVFVSQKGSGITKPADLSGKTIAVIAKSESAGEFEYQFRAMMKKLGLDASQSKLVAYDPSYKDFLSGDVDVTAAYLTGGVIKLRQKGAELNLIWPGDYGIHFYSDTLITTETLIEQQPELVERFLRATLKGWQYAIGNGDDAVENTLKYAQIKDRHYQEAMLKALRPLVHIGMQRIGWMEPGVWENMHQVLLANRILVEPVKDFNKVYTQRFIQSVYGKAN